MALKVISLLLLRNLFFNKIGNLGEHFWECNTNKKDVKQLGKLNNVLKSTIQAWNELHFNENKHDIKANDYMHVFGITVLLSVTTKLCPMMIGLHMVLLKSMICIKMVA